MSAVTAFILALWCVGMAGAVSPGRAVKEAGNWIAAFAAGCLFGVAIGERPRRGRE